ncbi:MAG: nucleoside triphosphate pyrophosphohydrolase [Clostridia bacterium]|nr:nucleoside triphosphate pyrophosphohydrolase [Clostridia bacterium]
MADFEFKEKYNFDDLVQIMRRLRAKDGCPWDAEQTHESIKANLIEETYEVIEAINKKDSDLLCEELGDVMMQVVFHAQMESEKGVFTIDDVTDGVCKKLVERHPHVFGTVRVDSVDDVLTNWEQIKNQSKNRKTTTQSMLSVPKELPALMRSSKVQGKAKKVGFDWGTIEPVYDKLDEEIAELKEAVAQKDKAHIKEELGDVLMTVVNLSRFIDCDAEECLNLSVDKFINRFSKVEQFAQDRSIDIKSAPIDKLEELWQEAKTFER